MSKRVRRQLMPVGCTCTGRMGCPVCVPPPSPTRDLVVRALRRRAQQGLGITFTADEVAALVGDR